MSENPLLVAEDVSHAYGEVDVLEDLSVTIDRGDVTAIVGPNGSGKTTLLRILAGLLTPSRGSVSYEGPEAARRIGYLPQRPTFRPGFTARETLEFYSALVEGDPEAPDDALVTVGLDDAGNRRVEALSGGMVRLLGIAQATIGDPPAVVLDEPGSGLDPGMRRRTFEIARDLATDGVGVLVSSHDLALVERTADRVLLLDRGDIVADGSPTALLADAGADSLWDVFESTTARTTDRVDVAGVSR